MSKLHKLRIKIHDFWLNNKHHIYNFLIIWAAGIASYAAGHFVGWNTPKELTYSQRRDIAIQFMCAEKHWQGMRNFCGNLPPADSKATQ